MTAVTSMRVLVVDDEPDAAEALTLLLKPRGFDVRVAGDRRCRSIGGRPPGAHTSCCWT